MSEETREIGEVWKEERPSDKKKPWRLQSMSQVLSYKTRKQAVQTGKFLRQQLGLPVQESRSTPVTKEEWDSMFDA